VVRDVVNLPPAAGGALCRVKRAAWVLLMPVKDE